MSLPDIRQEQIKNRTLKQRHLEALILFTGLAADRPDGTTECNFYFSLDTHVLSVWDGTVWRTTTMT